MNAQANQRAESTTVNKLRLFLSLSGFEVKLTVPGLDQH